MIKKIVYEFDSTEEAKEHLDYLNAGEDYEALIIDLRNRIKQIKDSDCSKKESIEHIEELIKKNNKYGY